MGLLASLLAVACLGADASPAEAPSVTYQVRLVEIRGLGWRAEAHDRLTPVVRQSGATVWTAPVSLGNFLGKRAFRTDEMPKGTVANGSEASFQLTDRHEYVADLRQVSDGSVGPSNPQSLEPEIDHIKDQVAIEARGRWVDQGLLAHVTIEEQRLAGLHATTVLKDVRNASRDRVELASLRGQIQVPQIVQSHVSGEWLIPNGALLIVSLGTHAQPNFDGEPVIVERLAIIEPSQVAKTDGAIVPTAEASPRSGAFDPGGALPMTVIGGASQLAAVLPTKLGVPVTCEVSPPKRSQEVAWQAPVSPSPLVNGRARPKPPSRILPTPINHKGEVVPLPPLPEDAGPIVSESETESGVARPAPQSRLRDRQKAAAAGGMVSSNEPLPEAKAPPNEPLPEAKAPDRTTSEARPNAPWTAAGQLQIALGFGPKGLALSGQLRLARGEAGSPEAIQALNSLVNTWAAEAQKRLTTTIGIAPETSDRSISQEIVATLDRFARDGQSEDGPRVVFGLQGHDSRGRPGHLAISIEANEAGRELLQRNRLAGLAVSMPTHQWRDPATHRASVELPSTEGHPSASDAAPLPPKLHEVAAIPESGQSEISRIGPDHADLVRAVVLGAGVVPSPLIFEAKPGLLDEAIQPASFTTEDALSRPLLFGLSPVPACPIFQADPLLIRVPVGRFGVIEVCPHGSGPHGLGFYW